MLVRVTRLDRWARWAGRASRHRRAPPCTASALAACRSLASRCASSRWLWQ